MQNLNGKVLNPLIDFNLIVNSEIGLIRFIRENFQDPRAFNLTELNKSDREILSLLYSRKNINPLSIISTEENLKDIDDLYKSFIENYQKEIFKKSITEQGIYSFVSMAMDAGINLGINPSICVHSDIEQNEIISHFNKTSFVSYSDTASILNKDVYYVKDFNFFTKIHIEDKVSHKKVYISPTQYNSDYFENTVNKLTSTNQIFFIGNNYREGEQSNEQ